MRADVEGDGNLVEAKYRRLARSHRTGPGDRDLKPSPEVRDLLNVSDSGEYLVFASGS
jgi:phosphatidylinositol 3-kinase